MGHVDSVRVRAPVKDVRLVLPLGFPIRGTVAGLREDGFRVSAIANGKRVHDVRVGSAGTFLISKSERRTVTLFVHKDGDPRYAVQERVSGGSEVTLALREGRAIEGRIVGRRSTRALASTRRATGSWSAAR